MYLLFFHTVTHKLSNVNNILFIFKKQVNKSLFPSTKNFTQLHRNLIIMHFFSSQLKDILISNDSIYLFHFPLLFSCAKAWLTGHAFCICGESPLTVRAYALFGVDRPQLTRLVASIRSAYGGEASAGNTSPGPVYHRRAEAHPTGRDHPLGVSNPNTPSPSMGTSRFFGSFLVRITRK